MVRERGGTAPVIIERFLYKIDGRGFQQADIGCESVFPEFQGEGDLKQVLADQFPPEQFIAQAGSDAIGKKIAEIDHVGINLCF